MLFTDSTSHGTAAIAYHHEPWLVVPAALIAVAGAYAALRIAGLIITAPGAGSGRRRWLLAGAALAMGLGTWGMHFVAMLAMITPFPIAYDAVVTLASIVPAIVASAACVYLITRPRTSPAGTLAAGLCMAAGIVTMHYAGMSAMRTEAQMLYERSTFFASIAAAIVMSILACVACTRTRATASGRRLPAAGGALLLGTAVSAMHFVGMTAIRLYPQDAERAIAMTDMNPRQLAGLVACCVIVVIGAVFGAAELDQRLQVLNARVRGRWRQLTAAIQGITEGFVLFDAQRRVVVWNSRIEDMAPELKHRLRPGARYEDIFGTAGASVPGSGGHNQPAAERTPDDAWLAEPDAAACRRFETADGRCLQVSEVAVENEYLVVSWTDITAHERSRQRLRAFFENAPYAFVVADPAGAIVHANRLALEVLGYTHKQLAGRPCGTIVAEDGQRALRAQLDDCLNGSHSPRADVQTQGLRRDGTPFPMAMNMNLMNLGSQPVVVIGIEDLSEQKRIEEQLSRSQKMEVVGQLTGGLAHDFNNLLTVVIGNLQLLETSVCGKEEVREQLRDALEAAGRGSELTKRLLAFSRRQILAPQSLSVNALVRDLIPLIGKTLTAQVEIVTRLAPGLWNVEIDPSQLENALLNLALNARDAMTGQGTLTVETRNETLTRETQFGNVEVEPGSYVRITVTDSGAGMSDAVLDRVFEPFFSTKGPGKGSGLGLSMVYGFVKQSKGYIAITSEIGKGTSVDILLPRSDLVPEEPTIVAGVRPAVPKGQERVLLVDDEQAVRRAVAGLLRNLGYIVTDVATADEALACIEDRALEFDLLFTDIVMPGGMSGLQLSERARQIRPALRVLLTSGYTDTAMLARGVLGTSDHFLNKPYRRSVLAEKLRAVLDQPQTA